MSARIILGVSLKMYFGYQQTLTWSQQVAEIARQHPAIVSGDVALFVLPAFPAIPAIKQIFANTEVSVGAQDLAWEDGGLDWRGQRSDAGGNWLSLCRSGPRRTSPSFC